MRCCDNCLTGQEVYDVPVGHEQGSQRDPYRVKVDLCGTCRGALLVGDFALLSTRYKARVERHAVESPPSGLPDMRS